MNKLKIGIIGHGFVGKAIDSGFESGTVEKFIVDPQYSTTIADMYARFVPDVIFVAVPTPMGLNGSIDSTIIETVFNQLNGYEHKPLVVVKSTVTPAVIQHLATLYPRLILNPEFLTERNAVNDFINADMLLIGGNNADDNRLLVDMYNKHSMCKPCPVHTVDLVAASIIKYTINSFLAAKVLFFNQINDVLSASGSTVDWNSFIGAIQADSRIGASHMSVPGPDGRRGFGGACFPKDTVALVHYAEQLGVPFTVLKEVVKINQSIRNQYEDLDDREREQNVNFGILK
jgi:UDPglucose 6-dehydrogenase